jgi:hypothetical protein
MSQNDANENTAACNSGAAPQQPTQSTPAQTPPPTYERPKPTAMPGPPERSDRGVEK